MNLYLIISILGQFVFKSSYILLQNSNEIKTFPKVTPIAEIFIYYLVLPSNMESISLKLEGEFLKDIQSIMKKHRYSTKTEFIREAIRDKIKDLEKEELILRAKSLYGASKRKTTDEDIHKAGEKAFRELERELK